MGINLPTAIGIGTLGVLGLPALASGSLALGAGAAAGGAAAGGGLLGGLFGGGGMGGLLGLGTLAAAAGPYMFGNKLNYSNENIDKKYQTKDYSREYDYEYVRPGADYEAGIDPEHMYFRKRSRPGYADGGLVSGGAYGGMTEEELMRYNDVMSAAQNKSTYDRNMYDWLMDAAGEYGGMNSKHLQHYKEKMDAVRERERNAIEEYNKRMGYAEGGVVRRSESTEYERARRKAEENAPSLWNFIRRSTIDRPIYGGWETPEGAAYAEAVAEMNRTGTPPETIFSRRNYAFGGLVGGQMPAGGVPNMFANFLQRGPMNMQRQWSPSNMQQFGQDFQKNISQGIEQLRGSFDQARQQMQSQQSNWAPQPQPRKAFSGGGLVKGYAQGGLASLAGPEQAGDEGTDDKTLIEQAAMALMGQLDDPKPVLMEFVKTFGKDALNDLAERVQMIQQGQEPGPAGDGLSDSIPANLSEGEYVVPADVVSGLGNGSTDAGGKHLDSMVERARQMRGTPAQPAPVNPMAAMPV